MYKHNDLTGKQFGRLRVVEQSGRTSDRHILWGCICDCGKETTVSSKDLLSGHTKSCGCLQKEAISAVRFKHGDRGKRLYIIWSSMRKRCENEKDSSYKWYGGKGVIVCEEWHDYSVFRDWAYDNGYNPVAPFGECTIDRINPYGNYEPSNCRWINMSEQAKNKRKRRGET